MLGNDFKKGVETPLAAESLQSVYDALSVYFSSINKFRVSKRSISLIFVSVVLTL
jgi:hypothetical protein